MPALSNKPVITVRPILRHLPQLCGNALDSVKPSGKKRKMFIIAERIASGCIFAVRMKLKGVKITSVPFSARHKIVMYIIAAKLIESKA